MKDIPRRTNRQNKPRSGLHFKVALILGIFIAGMALSSGWKLFNLRLQVEGQLAELNQEKVVLIQQETILLDEIERLKTPSYIEKLAREQLGLVKRGEILISPKN